MSNKITMEELVAVYNNTSVVFTDAEDDAMPPFIQADSFQKIIDLTKIIKKSPMNHKEIAEFLQFELRQASYYSNASIYLGLLYNHDGKFYLTKLGKKVCSLQEKESNLLLVSCILRHQIFNEIFNYIISNDDNSILFDDQDKTIKRIIINRMLELKVCGKSVADRRATSVLSWLKWIFLLTK